MAKEHRQWPRGAVHGPFTKLPAIRPQSRTVDASRRQEMRAKLSNAIREGGCRCQMCEERGKPKGLPEGWMWARAPTPEMHRNGKPGSPLGWPTWIMRRPVF